MDAVTLTPHQQQALEWLVEHLSQGESLVALRGLAGTGKTTVIPALRDALAQCKLSVVVGSPTHRAAMILRKKGITDADTVHAHALTPYFTADYTKAAQWLGEEVPCKWGGDDVPHEAVNGIPWLIHEAIKPDLEKAQNLRRYGRQHPAKKRLASIGIHGREHFAGFGAKAGEGVLIIDEASMVGERMLALCTQAYKQVCLIGDPGQLPPVKDVSVLATVPGVDLTEVHRQAQDSGIIRLAYQAREGQQFWREAMANGQDVQECTTMPAQAFLDAPLIVWKNETRKTCTRDIRAALGFAPDVLHIGEPLVCKSTSPEDRAEGFYNNALYRVVDCFVEDPRSVIVEDALGETAHIRVHIEELDGNEIDPRAIPFRFGYCLTAHTAQGGEWPIVYVSLPDLTKYANFCTHTNKHDDIARWAYTAITRARTTLMFATRHVFVSGQGESMATPKVSPPSAPMMTEPPPAPLDLPEDDIADPVVPQSVIEAVTPTPAVPSTLPPLPEETGVQALLQGFCQHLQHRIDQNVLEHHKSVMEGMGAVVETVRKVLESAAQSNEHSQYQLSDALLKLQEQGLALRHDPYTVRVQAVAPQGYPVEISVAKGSVHDIIGALPALMQWLADQSYKPVVG